MLNHKLLYHTLSYIWVDGIFRIHFFHSNIIYFMSLLHIVVVISMDKLISFECDNNNRKIPFKKNRRLSTHIVRSYSSSQFEKSSTNSNSNYIKVPKINLLINYHVCLMLGGGGGGQITFLSFLFLFF